MKVAVTDANIFIDLINLKLISNFFDLKIAIHTSLEVLGELYSHQQEVLLAYKNTSKLTIHNLNDIEFGEMLDYINAKQLSDADKTVIYIAYKIQAIVLSSDGPARKIAKQKKLETHGLIWLFDEFVKTNHLSKPIACSKIKELLSTNRRYREDKRMNEEFEKRLKDWDEK